MCVYLCRFTILTDSPALSEIIGSQFQIIDGTTFFTSTVITFSNQDQFHLFLILTSRFIVLSSHVTILLKCFTGTNFLFYHYFAETKDKCGYIQESQSTVEIT